MGIPPDDRDSYREQAGDHAELLSSGRDDPALHERVPRRWRLRLVALGIFAAGLVLGGYAGHLWLESAERPREAVELTARVTAVHGLYQAHPPYRLAVELHNTGSVSVTLEQVRVKPRAFDVVLSPQQPRTVQPARPVTVLYAVNPRCDAGPPREMATVEVQARPSAGTMMRTLTLRAPVSDAVRAGYAIMCGRAPPGVTLRATTLRARDTAEGLSLRIELAAVSAGRVKVPGSLRLLDVTLAASGLSSRVPGASARGASSLPETVVLTLAVEDCERAEAARGEPTRLTVAMTSAKGPYLLYAHLDADFSQAVRRYVTDHCGGGGN